jgi:hypothetical protein
MQQDHSVPELHGQASVALIGSLAVFFAVPAHWYKVMLGIPADRPHDNFRACNVLLRLGCQKLHRLFAQDVGVASEHEAAIKAYFKPDLA